MKKTGKIQILLILMVLIHKPIFGQIVAMDTMYRTSDTIYFKLTEKIEVDTSYNIFPIEKKSKITSFNYTIKTLKNHDYLIENIISNIKSAKIEKYRTVEYCNGKIWNIPFRKIDFYKDNGFFRVFVDLKNQKNQPIIHQKLKEIVFETSLQQSGIDTIELYADPFDTYDLDSDTAGNLIHVPIPDSLILNYNNDQNIYEIIHYGLRDNYTQLQEIYSKSSLPLGNIEELFFDINVYGNVKKCYHHLENSDSILYDEEKIFKDVKFPALKINDVCQPYKIRTRKEIFEKPIENRFVNDYKQNINIYPVFSGEDSLILYLSKEDHQYHLFSIFKNEYSNSRLLCSFSDSTPINKLFYDFNKDGLIDFVIPPFNGFFCDVTKVVYGGGEKDKDGLAIPATYYNIKYSTDSSCVSSSEKQFELSYRQYTLYKFVNGGDSIMLQCTFNEVYPSSFSGYEEYLKNAIMDKNNKHGEMYHFVNNIDPQLSQKNYYVLNRSKAKKEYKKMKKLIKYYLEHPEKVPQ
jgi:hypothetical protein